MPRICALGGWRRRWLNSQGLPRRRRHRRRRRCRTAGPPRRRSWARLRPLAQERAQGSRRRRASRGTDQCLLRRRDHRTRTTAAVEGRSQRVTRCGDVPHRRRRRRGRRRRGRHRQRRARAQRPAAIPVRSVPHAPLLRVRRRRRRRLRGGAAGGARAPGAQQRTPLLCANGPPRPHSTGRGRDSKDISGMPVGSRRRQRRRRKLRRRARSDVTRVVGRRRPCGSLCGATA
mmetsp:Transcript_9452/g.33239  ORF Transcript_9452/g.33239 Transcript_9452/m.33239 type:complete len:231 (+) Transcript_9452:2571-3263(+)